jgi:hypothetical protein
MTFLRGGRVPGAATLLLSLTLLVGLMPTATAVETQPETAASAVAWLTSQQLDDGAFPGFSGDADPSTTADAVVALAATGADPATITSAAGNDPVSYLLGLAPVAAESPGAAAKLILALHAARGSAFDASDVGGVDLVAAIEDSYDSDAGTYGEGLFTHAYALMALRVAGAPVEPGALGTLIDSQIGDGSWNFNGDTTPGTGDSNTTAMALQALAITGAGQDAISAGLAYLASVQAADGSFAYDASATPLVGDANSTALAVQALIAVGRDPATLPNGDAIAALATFQQPSGALTWQQEFPEDNMFATLQAIPALVGAALPVSYLGAAPEPAESVDAAIAPATGLGLDGCLYFVATFHNMCGPFAQYWEANGGLKLFGYPLTETFLQDGVDVQYFERTRLEHHPDAWPENFDILQGRLGAEQLGLGSD